MSRWPAAVLRWLLALPAACTGWAFRLLPLRRRFGAAKRVAFAIAPIISRTRLWRLRALPHVNGPRETALQLVLRALDGAGTAYVPTMRREGFELLAEARAAGRGALVLGPHSGCGLLITRHLHDRRESWAIVSRQRMSASGANAAAPTIILGPTFLVGVRTLLRKQGIVVAAADHVAKSSRRIAAVPTSEGPVYLSDALIRVALRCGAAVLFIAGRIDQAGEVIVSLRAATPGAAAEEVSAEFARFIQDLVEQKKAAVWQPPLPGPSEEGVAHSPGPV